MGRLPDTSNKHCKTTSAGCLLALLAALVGYRALVFGRALMSIQPSFRIDELLLGRELLIISISNTLNNDHVKEENEIMVQPEQKQQQSTTTLSVDNDKAMQQQQHQQQEIKQHAYVPSLRRNVTLPIPIVLYPYVIEGSKGEQAMQICENGVRESPFFNSTTLYDFSPDVIWIMDTTKNLKRFCYTFTQEIQRVQALRAQQGLPKSWPIHVFDNGDEPIIHECKSLEILIGTEYYHYHKRSIVQNRYWDDTINWIHVGEKLVVFDIAAVPPAPPPSSATDAMTMTRRNNKEILFDRFHHVNIPVRTDMVLAIAKYVNTSKYNHLTINDNLESALPRPIDVAHFWPRNKQNKTQFFSKSYNNNKNNKNKQVQDGFLVQSSNLRDTVGLVLDHLDGSLVQLEEEESHPDDAVTTTGATTTTTRRITTFAGAQGRGRILGRSTVQEVYLETLLSTKIHVVAQRDEWEDHFRLLEALVSGAMVMTDVMLTLPAGLKDGVSVVVYYSAQDLTEKIQYYLSHPRQRLAIARTGRRIAMSRHRAQHRMEEMIFETPLSTICQDCPLTEFPGAHIVR